MIKITLPDEIRNRRNPEVSTHETIDAAITYLIAWNDRYAWEAPDEREWAGGDLSHLPAGVDRDAKALWYEDQLLTQDEAEALTIAARRANDDPNAIVEINSKII